MLIFENILIALSSLWSSKMRSFLTMLGIIIGISSVITIITVGNNMTSQFTSELSDMGAGSLTLSVQRKTTDDGTTGTYTSSDGLTAARIAQFAETFADEIEYIGFSESIYTLSSATSGTNSVSISASGTNNDYLLAQNLTLLTGRLLTDTDSDNRTKLALVSDSFCEELYGEDDPIGKTFDLSSGNAVYTFYVVGVYESDDSAMMGFNTTETIYLPLWFAQQVNQSDGTYTSITLSVRDTYDVDTVEEEINTYFVNEYADNTYFYAECFNMQSIISEVTAMFDTVSYVIAAIAAISLLVGGIGVMNIMLVSITERTREIGIRKALGATNNSIRLQFIIESVVICIIGGILGIILGTLAATALANLVGITASPSGSAIAIAVTFSMAIGVFFGYYPANKAAKLNLIEALKYE